MTDITERMRALIRQLKPGPGEPLTPAAELAILAEHLLDSRAHVAGTWKKHAARVASRFTATSSTLTWEQSRSLPVSQWRYADRCPPAPAGCGEVARLSGGFAELVHHPGCPATAANRWDWFQSLPLSPAGKCPDRPRGCGTQARTAPDGTVILMHESGCPVLERERFDTFVRTRLTPGTAALAEQFADLVAPERIPDLMTLVLLNWRDNIDAPATHDATGETGSDQL